LTWAQALRHRRASAYAAGTGLDAAVGVCRRLKANGLACTVGYAALPDEPPRAVADVHIAAFDRLAAEDIDGQVSVKLSGLNFDAELLAEVQAAAARASRPLHVDALGPETVDATWLMIQSLPGVGRAGVTLPGRWRRSAQDASLAAELDVRVRIVKGQWSDGIAGDLDPAAGFLAVVDRLRGHRRPVAIATHDVELLEEALRRLTAARTPCTAELYFGLPFRAPALTARRLGVPVRVYVAYGGAGAPYGIREAARRPAAAWWLLQDLILGKDKTWVSIRRSHLQAS
jgi:proline dehydrogenase